MLPGVHDFIRLVPVSGHLLSLSCRDVWEAHTYPQPTPLAHGALFARSPIKYKQWIVEVAFRVHGPPTTSGAGETGEDGQTKRLHKGGRGLAFWYTKVSEAAARESFCDGERQN